MKKKKTKRVQDFPEFQVPFYAENSINKVPAYALGGAVSGAMSGASTGAAFGPWGAAIGGVMGLVSGSRAEDNALKQQKEQLGIQTQLQRNNQSQAISSQLMADWWHNNELALAYAQGGIPINNDLAAVSKGEVVRDPQQGIQTINQGSGKDADDVLIDAPNSVLGSNKIPGTNQTFAEAGQAISKMYNKKSKYNDARANKAKELNQKHANVAYDALLNMQELDKMRKGKTNQKTKNIKNTRVFAHEGGTGGTDLNPYVARQVPYDILKSYTYTNKPFNWYNVAPGDNTNYQYTQQPTNTNLQNNSISITPPKTGPLNTQSITTGLTNAFTPQFGIQSQFNVANPSNLTSLNNTNTSVGPVMGSTNNVNNNTPNTNPQNKFGTIMGMLGQLAPVAYNLFSGRRSETEPVVQNQYSSQYLDNMSRRRVDIRAIRNDLMRAQTTQNYNAMNISPNTGQRAAYMAANAANTRSQLMDMNIKAQDMNNQYLAQLGQAQYQVGTDTSNEVRRINEINARNRAAQRSFTTAGISQLGQFAGVQMQRQAQLQQNQSLADALAMYWDTGVSSAETQRILGQYGITPKKKTV